jgi:hypothetical protein
MERDLAIAKESLTSPKSTKVPLVNGVDRRSSGS